MTRRGWCAALAVLGLLGVVWGLGATVSGRPPVDLGDPVVVDQREAGSEDPSREPSVAPGSITTEPAPTQPADQELIAPPPTRPTGATEVGAPPASLAGADLPDDEDQDNLDPDDVGPDDEDQDNQDLDDVGPDDVDDDDVDG